MRSSRSLTSSLREGETLGYPVGFKAQANRIAIGIRRQLGLSPVDPLDPYSVADRMGIGVVPVDSFEDRCPGEVAVLLGEDGVDFAALYCSSGDGVRFIVLNDRHSLGRRNSSLCHEIGHAVLGHPAEVFAVGGEYRKTEVAYERQADFLAGCMLVPNEAADHIVWSGLDFEEAMATYGVSSKMLKWRLNVSGAWKKYGRARSRFGR